MNRELPLNRARRISSQITLVLVLAILPAVPALCQDDRQTAKSYKFEFTNIADTTQGFGAFGLFPAINNHGEVAFTANRNDTGLIFRTRGGADTVTTIASSADSLSQFGDDVAVNPGGVVAFDATTATGSRAIFKSDGVSKTLIADSTVNGLAKIGVGSPAINADGIVAFSSSLAQRGSPAAVFAGAGGALRTVVSTSPTGFTGFGNVAIQRVRNHCFSSQSGRR